MKELSLDRFIIELAEIAVREKTAEHEALSAAATILYDEVRSEFGTYQEDIQPFVDWAELADSTKADRVRRGFTENDPLLRTGELRDSVGYMVGEGEAHVGSNDPIAEYQELGTSRIPPRSVFGAAGVRRADDVRKIVGRAVVLALTGEQVHEKALVTGIKE